MLRGILAENVLLKRYTSWRIGGPAARLYKPADTEDLIQFLQQLPVGEPLLWLGLGSNVLIADEGFPGTVILTQGRLKEMVLQDENSLWVEAGVSCGQAARFAARLNYTGLEFLAGIPGTIGGALAMNAGCYGSETWQHVIAVETVDRQGNIIHRLPDAYNIAYRQVDKPCEEWFLRGLFRLANGNKQQSLREISALLQRRADTQPTSEYSCGSVFRNPPGDYAARLIEASGLKGYRIGNAQVSPKHGNFIINCGEASAQHIKELIAYIAKVVKQRFGIELQREVHIIE